MSNDKTLRWTLRGTSQCSNCAKSYSNAWKPKNCKHCGYEIGGTYVPKPKKQKVQEHSTKCVLIVDGDTEIKIFSVKLSPRHNHVFVVQTGDSFVCHSEKCKEKRAVHIASTVPFTCDHTDAVQTFSYPVFAKNLKEEDILAYNCDNATRSMLRGDLHPPTDFRHVVCISEGCYAVFSGTCKGPSNPIGYCHVLKEADGHWLCSNKSCRKTSGNSKQVKTRKICMHLHILFSVLRLSSTPGDTPSSSGTVVASPETISSRTQEPLPISRVSSIKLNLMRPLIPYPVPVEMLLACREYSKSSRPSCFVPSSIECGLCGSPLTEGRRHPGQGPEDVSYLLTPSIFCHVNVQVKICTNKECKAMHQVWPIDQGLFNICDKIIVAVEILVHWRNLFRQGVPLTISIESSLSVWVKCAQLQFNDSELKYITGMLYNGFYAFELLSDRSLDNVVCGICGVVGQIYYGDGNEKNCCSTHSVDYSKVSQAPNDGPPLSLENFLEKMKGIFVEKITYTTSNQDGKVVASNVPPIIAPSLRAPTVFNTEMEKKSVYLEGKYFKKDAINGDPMMLHYIIKNKPLDMASLECLPIEELRAICRDCKINNVARLSKALLLHTLQLLYSSILTGASPCHGFTQVANNTGGFYHMVCRHGATVASKFLLLQESVRDAADLYLSLKYPPVLLVNDTPCGFARHLDIREPSLTKHLWGDCLGCFQKPDPDMEPKEVSIPQIVPSEFSSINLSTEALSIDSARQLQHPLTGSVRRSLSTNSARAGTDVTVRKPFQCALCSASEVTQSMFGSTLTMRGSVRNRYFPGKVT